VLQLTPETLALAPGTPFPDPLHECEFWGSRATDLESIIEQVGNQRRFYLNFILFICLFIYTYFYLL
jgi:hypothetical protein